MVWVGWRGVGMTDRDALRILHKQYEGGSERVRVGAEGRGGGVAEVGGWVCVRRESGSLN